MTTVVTDRVGSSNIRVTLSDKDAEATLRHVLMVGRPDVLAVQEWDGPAPDLDLQRRVAIGTDNLLRRVTAGTTYKFRRPGGGGGPVVWDNATHALESIESVELAPRQNVGFIPGRRTTLPASVATVARFRDRRTGFIKVVINVHLTAEIQKGKGYRTDRLHRKRVRRHQSECRAIVQLVKIQGNTPRTRVYVCGDFNFDGMVLPPLVACWVGHPKDERAGTLGTRTVDYVFGEDRAEDVIVIVTRSDHDTIVVVYVYKVKENS